jgi:hypothetical protein
MNNTILTALHIILECDNVTVPCLPFTPVNALNKDLMSYCRTLAAGWMDRHDTDNTEFLYVSKKLVNF